MHAVSHVQTPWCGLGKLLIPKKFWMPAVNGRLPTENDIEPPRKHGELPIRKKSWLPGGHGGRLIQSVPRKPPAVPTYIAFMALHWKPIPPSLRLKEGDVLFVLATMETANSL